jgi:hypothetical protein
MAKEIMPVGGGDAPRSAVVAVARELIFIMGPASCADEGVLYNCFVPLPIDQWLRAFDLEPALRACAAEVFAALPANVRDDLMDDPAFMLCDYEPGRAMDVPMRMGPGQPARTVALKRTLLQNPPAFVRWLIAHELAHAFLRHGLAPCANDKAEADADALAADWGFPKPPLPPRRR